MDDSKPPEHRLGMTDEEPANVMYTVPFVESFIYSNCSAMAASPLDLHLSFAEAMPDHRIVGKVGVVMPLEHAAILTMGMLRQLVFCEKNFGPIRVPDWQAFKSKAESEVADVQGAVDMLNIPVAIAELRERIAELPSEEQEFVRQIAAEYDAKKILSRLDTLKIVDLRRRLG
jgi:hypothetical protein